MARIYTSDIHRNENASLMFGAAIANAVGTVREDMANLASSRKADEYAPGSIHVLRKLCEGEGISGHIHQLEVQEWRDTFFAWFARVKRWFPAKLADDFRAKADEDFQVILGCANEMPESFWRDDIPKRRIQISFENEDALIAAREAAERKHPVPLGSALHKYIEACVEELVRD